MIRVTNIQRMCFDDGPGIRTTVFLKGCVLHCPWCSNPENILFEKQDYCYEKNGSCTYGTYGKDYHWEDLLKVVKKDYKFWGAEGGVTFSGGEPLMQAMELEPLLSNLQGDGISIAVETSLFVLRHFLEVAWKYIDYYYVDVKILDKVKCQDILGGDVEVFKSNISWLRENGGNVIFRVPCSGKYVLTKSNMDLLCDFFLEYRQYPIEIFSLHHLGDDKYRALGKIPPEIEPVSEKKLQDLKARLQALGCNVKIISF